MTTSRSGDILTIQALRAVAALMVVAFHLAKSLTEDFGLFAANPLKAGAAGVDVFFVISGFIICHATSRPDGPLRFFAKRVARVAPLYYLLTFAVFGVALVAPHVLNATSANPEYLLKSLAFVPFEKAPGQVTPLLFLGWTLNYEMFFYLVFALTLTLARGRWRIAMASGLIILCVGVGLWLKPNSVTAQFYSAPIMLEFVWGCVVYAGWTISAGRLRFLRYAWMPAALLLCLGDVEGVRFDRALTTGLPAALLLASVLHMTMPAGPASRIALLLGNASYSIYLVHPFVIQAATKLILPHAEPGPLVVACIVLAVPCVVIAASLAMFRYFEQPTNNWLRSFLPADRSPS